MAALATRPTLESMAALADYVTPQYAAVQFQARVSRQILQGIGEGTSGEDSEVAEPPRSSLVDLKAKGKNKARAPINRVGDALKSRSQGLSALSAPPQQIPSQSSFAVFDENAGAPLPGGLAATTDQPW
ncbi:unnamed protein product [Ranitomeya imitator]|uniref:Uncharacterized protein n=1 Tax=Ranitomeya imitator TaxID=111125 RepID=A0ABN9MM02_9NEOB|nr:unnamed protein product [Ranitomeya imitator]